MSNSYRVCSSVSVLAALLLVGVLPAVGEDLTAAQTETFERKLNSGIPVQTVDEHGVYKISAVHLPLSSLVESFFNSYAAILLGEEWTHDPAIRQRYGFEKGSAGEVSLFRAMQTLTDAKRTPEQEAERRQKYREAQRSGNDAEWYRLGREESAAEYRLLGEVWGQFVEDLGGPGAKEMIKIRETIEGHRATLSIVATDSFEDPHNGLWVNSRTFDAAVASVLPRTANYLD